MSNKNQAIAAAKRAAKRSKDWRYVVYEPEVGYMVAEGFELETFFLGAPVEWAVGPDGSVEAA